ncbi:hypothetical protein Agub_g14984, partial [Astrephomene gubernaculifera]
GRRRIWGEEADARAADMGREPASFQDFFYIYGGEQLAEEVTHLANECAHLCNKSRSKLEADQQQALDEVLARLGPYFNDPAMLGLPQPSTASTSDTADAAGVSASGAVSELPLPDLDLAEGSREAAERLGVMYDPIGYLCQDSQSRSEAFLLQIREAAAAAKGDRSGEASASHAEGEALKQPLLAPEEGQSLEGGEDARLSAAAAAQQQPPAPAVPELLAAFRGHFTKRVAEVTTAQLQLMLNLGASLAAPARTGRPAVDGISWPDSSEQQAALLAGEARRMVADLQTVTDAYLATVAALRTQKQEEQGGAVEGGVASSMFLGVDEAALEEMEASLRVYAESASASIKAGYKGLLYAVLLRSLVTRVAQQQQEEEEGEQEEKVDAEDVVMEVQRAAQ